MLVWMFNQTVFSLFLSGLSSRTSSTRARASSLSPSHSRASWREDLTSDRASAHPAVFSVPSPPLCVFVWACMSPSAVFCLPLVALCETLLCMSCSLVPVKWRVFLGYTHTLVCCCHFLVFAFRLKHRNHTISPNIFTKLKSSWTKEYFHMQKLCVCRGVSGAPTSLYIIKHKWINDRV